MIVERILIWAIPVICSGLLGLIIKIFKDERAMKAALLSLIRSQIVNRVEFQMELGYLPEYARYCMNELHTNYKQLGGNHGIDELINQCFKLPSSPKHNRRKDD